jgi:DNA-binding transcriptional ArsR family regulator
MSHGGGGTPGSTELPPREAATLRFDAARSAHPAARRQAALGLLREMRRLDEAVGVKHSGIARDVGLLLYETGERGLSVNEVCARTGYSGPTVRLVLERLIEAKSACPGGRQGKTQLYRLTPSGIGGFDGYVTALFGFAEAAGALSAAGGPATAPDPRSGPTPPPARHAGAPPGQAAAD